MTQPSHVAFIGNSLPRRCGIAIFTTDLQQGIATAFAHVETSIVAMTDHGHAYDYPSVVRLQVNADRIEDYVHAADVLNAGQFDVVSLQHEFGIFGGEAGDHIMALLSRLTMPTVTTLHTVLSGPTPVQRGVMDRIVDASSRVVVMAEKGRELLRTLYRMPAEKIEVIPRASWKRQTVQPVTTGAMHGRDFRHRRPPGDRVLLSLPARIPPAAGLTSKNRDGGFTSVMYITDNTPSTS